MKNNLGSSLNVILLSALLSIGLAGCAQLDSLTTWGIKPYAVVESGAVVAYGSVPSGAVRWMDNDRVIFSALPKARLNILLRSLITL